MTLSTIILLLVSAVLYFIPTIVARMRQHRNTTAIFVLNLLGGWLIIGWVAAIVWASTNDVVRSAR